MSRNLTPRRWGPTDIFTTPSTLDRLWEPINKRRGDTKTVTVQVDDLVAVLRDHARFCDVIKTKNPS